MEPNQGRSIPDHFVDINKMVDPGMGDEALFGKITIHNVREFEMQSERQISREHFTNNQAVRENSISRGIRPEALPPAEDVKKVERRLTSEEKKALKNPERLEKG